MATLYSTRNVQPRERLSYWVEVATKEFYRHDFSSGTGQAFLGDLYSGVVGQLWVGRCTCDPCDVGRSRRDIVRDDVDDILLTVRLSGRSLISQSGHDVVHDAGTMAMLDSRRPSGIHFRTPMNFLVARVPRRMLEARLGSLSTYTGRSFPTDSPVAGLASGFVSMLVDRSDTFDGVVGAKIADQALDLIALAFSEEKEGANPVLSSPRTAALIRLKSTIEANLCDPELKPASAAAAAGISVRYANALLAEEDTSIERYIMHRRLERCRHALEDPTQSHRMIGEIAFSWGFSDLSHFGRRFRSAYGMTPGDYRRSVRERSALTESMQCTPALQSVNGHARLGRLR